MFEERKAIFRSGIILQDLKAIAEVGFFVIICVRKNFRLANAAAALIGIMLISSSGLVRFFDTL